MRAPSNRVSASERSRLIEVAATKLFAERGFSSTTVEDIVQAAGVTKPMLYRHFESKQELCVTLLRRYRVELVAAPLAQFTPSEGPSRIQLASMVDAWLEHIQMHADASRLLFAPITGDPEVERVQRELYADQRATHVALLREFIPELGAAEAEPLGEAVRAGFAAVAVWWLDHPGVGREVPAGVLRVLISGAVMALGSPD